jgi:hypothetical protein
MPTQPYKQHFDPSVVDPQLAEAIIASNEATGRPLRIPGTTTVIGRFKESGALMWWANQEGLAGRPIRGPESRVEQACEAGTLAHAMIEADIRGKDRPDISRYPLGIVEKAQSGFAAYLEWRRQTNLQPVHTEMPLTSAVWMYGGTLDAMLVGGKLSLGDWKTSNAVYMDHLLQLAAYRNLWEEHFPEQPIHGLHLLRFSKEGGDFAHHFWSELKFAWEMFRHLRISFELDKIVKKRL